MGYCMNKEIKANYQKEKANYKNSYYYRVRSDYYSARKKYKIKDNVILYEAFYGRAVTCNPGALFRYILNDTRFKNFEHIIVLEKSEHRKKMISEFKGHKNVKFVVPNTDLYFRYLSQAKYLINNSTFQAWFSKKDGQIVVNTWHGIPLKHLGYDLPNGNIVTANVVRNFLFSDYIISPVPYTTEHFKRSYKLDGIYQGRIIETGYPRVDATYTCDRNKIYEILNAFGVKFDKNKKLILYAPTWRGESFGSPDISTDIYEEFKETVYKYINKNEYQVLVKPHQVVYKSLMQKGELPDYFIPSTIDTNLLLGSTDILISDYSSIFFDFLVTGRPIYFFMPDLAEYKESRGIYISPDELPGPISESLEDLGRLIGDVENYKNQFNFKLYEGARERFTKYDDGNVCERVVNAVFFGDEKNTVKLKNEKKKILFHTDMILPNGVSMSLLNMLNLIDTDKYDITFFAVGNQKNKFVIEYLERINPKIRILFRTSTTLGNSLDIALQKYCLQEAIVETDNNKLFPTYLYETEFKRNFGDIKFDLIIDFSGFSAFWENLFCTQKDTPRFIWQHSVLMREYNRMANGKKVFETALNSIFKIYPSVQKIIACSKHTMQCNRNDIATEKTYDRFDYLFNPIDYNRILSLANESEIIEYKNDRYLNTEPNNEVQNSINMVPLPKKDYVTFVTVGRLSEMKNHINMIKAFERINKEFSNTQLYIIGDGPEYDSIKATIKETRVKNVILTGNMSNPFALLKYCDCFMLPSTYEGQPMVLLEARLLNLPIIVSNFDTISDSSFPDGQLIIGMEEDDIYGGMKAFIDGNVPNGYIFDPKVYNDSIMEKLYSLIDIELKKKGRETDV